MNYKLPIEYMSYAIPAPHFLKINQLVPSFPQLLMGENKKKRERKHARRQIVLIKRFTDPASEICMIAGHYVEIFE